MTAGSQEWSKYPFLIKSNRPGTKRGRSTAGRPTTILPLGISDHYKPKGRFFCDSKERCRYDLIEAFAAWQPPDRLRPAPILYRWERTSYSFTTLGSQTLHHSGMAWTA